jgi:hypothetical protein
MEIRFFLDPAMGGSIVIPATSHIDELSGPDFMGQHCYPKQRIGDLSWRP